MPVLPSIFAAFSNRDMIALGLVFVTVAIMIWFRKIPEPWAIKHYLSALNDRGGNILILMMLAMYFFSTSVRMFYFAFDNMVSGKLQPENAILLMGLQFVTGTAFGGAVAVLYKTMTGSDSMTRGTDGAPGTRSTTTTVTSAGNPPSTAALPAVVIVPDKPAGSATTVVPPGSESNATQPEPPPKKD